MGISITSVLRQSAKFNAVTLISKGIAFPVSFVVASILLPEEYGFVGYVSVWLSYGMLVALGTTAVPFRELPLVKSEEEMRRAVRRQNTAISIDLLFNCLITLILLGIGMVHGESTFIVGFTIVAISLLFSKSLSYYEGMLLSRQSFGTVARSRLVSSLIISISTLGFVFVIKEYSLLVSPILGAVVALVYLWNRESIGFRFEWSWEDVKGLIVSGVQLQALTVVFRLSKMVDLTLVAAMFAQREIGLYAFAAGLITKVMEFFNDFARVLQPLVYKDAAGEHYLVAFTSLIPLVLQAGFITGVLVSSMSIGFLVVVRVFLTNYVDSILIFFLMGIKILIFMFGVFPNIVLSSSMVNKQNESTKSYLLGIIVMAVAGLLLYNLGLGLVGIVIALLGANIAVTARQYIIARPYLFSTMMSYRSFMIKAGILLCGVASNVVVFYLADSIVPRNLEIIALAGSWIVIWSIILIGLRRDLMIGVNVQAAVDKFIS